MTIDQRHGATLLLCFLLASLGVMAQDVDRTPQFFGTIRPRYEYVPSEGVGRFQVRNARVGLSGRLTRMVGYGVLIDACDRGKIKVLDAYAAVQPNAHIRLQAGQMRVPFSLEGMRPAHLQMFANKSFVAAHLLAPRACGFKAHYDAVATPWFVEAGVFNAHNMTDHTAWEGQMAYAVKTGTRVGNVRLEASLESLCPDSVRINRYDFGASWECDRWHIEGEYLHSHYAGNPGSLRNAHAYFAAADYRMPIRAGELNQLSFQARWDGMTDSSNGTRGPDGELQTTWSKRNRLALGSTIGCMMGRVRYMFRLNYEFYFYPHGVTPSVGDRSKIIAEMVVRF